MPKYSNPVSYAGRKATQNLTGNTRFATASEAAAASSETLAISPATLSSAVGDLVPSATTAIEGVVLLTDNSSPVATKAYADALAIAGAPAWSESVSGIGQLSTTAEATAGTNDDTAMTPLKVAAVMAAPPAIGSGTPAAGSFTTLSATGAIDFDAGGSFESGGAAIDIGADASADAINIGTGAAARTITMGNVTGATALAFNAGTGGIALASTGAGDITINSDDTLLLDADGVLELNSSGGVIGIGNDADAQDINIGTGAAARTITLGNSTGATQIDLESGTGPINVGTNAIAHTVTVGNKTGASAVVLEVGTGNFSLDGVAGSTYSIGASTTTGTITIGGTAQTGTLSIGDTSGTMTLELGAGEGATTVAIAGGATNAKTVTIADGAVASTVAIGSGSAGAITIDTGSTLSLDAAGATNLSTSSGDLTLQASAGSVNLIGNEDDAGCVLIEADGGTSERVRLHSDQGTGTDSIILDSDVGGVTLTATALANAAAIDINAPSGGCTIDTGLGISLDAAGASNFSTSGAGVDLDLASAAGRVIVTAGEDAADAIYLHADAGTSEKIRIHSDQGTSVDSVELESDAGGITLTAGLASADAINLTASAGGVDIDGALEVNIASSRAATGAVTLNASNAAGNITMTGGVACTPDSITSDNAGVAASINTGVTLITTDGDSNLDNVTLADGLLAGQVKHFAVIAAGNAADSVKITPANMAGGTQITFAADPTGLGCSMVFDGTNWTVFSNNGGTIS